MYLDRQSLRIGATALLTGFCFGLGTGILFAPHSGVRTRRWLTHVTEDMIENTKEVIDEAMYTGKHLKGLMAVR